MVERARAVLAPHISAYYAAEAGSSVGLDEGTADWSAVRFRPRVLRDVLSEQRLHHLLDQRA
jgi:isopentenyl diphosphate isomerase/L-lactate dehydrogenase-like FMN-dependent dehydrogenase